MMSCQWCLWPSVLSVSVFMEVKGLSGPQEHAAHQGWRVVGGEIYHHATLQVDSLQAPQAPLGAPHLHLIPL